MRNNPIVRGAQEETGLIAELWQFAVVLGLFAVAALLWLFVIYLPARTMEHSESRQDAEQGRDAAGGAG